MVLAPVMVLAYKSRGPKGLQLEVGARGAPRLLVSHILEGRYIGSFSIAPFFHANLYGKEG